MRFKKYLYEDDIEKIIEVAIFMEEFNYLDEGIGDLKNKIKNLLPKIGLRVEKKEEGLIQILAKSGKTLAKFFWYALKSSMGDVEAKKKVKELSKKEVKKEEILDFLLKLDMVTLHLLSEPVHMIEALTGWKLEAFIMKYEKEIKNFTEKVDKALVYLEDAAKNASSSLKGKITSYIKSIKNLVQKETMER